MAIQVLFSYNDDIDGYVQAGIQLDNGTVVCACCGAEFDQDEVEIIEEREIWTDFEDAIVDDDWSEESDCDDGEEYGFVGDDD